jgi:GGDEF domain-containing protein
VVVYLLTEYKDRAEREEILARTDPLTEVANSRYLYTLAEMEIERLSRYEHPFTVAYMDIDNFKEINDRFGRRAGDELLCLVASTMQNNLRITDTVARLGGDEFIILLPETKGRGRADHLLPLAPAFDGSLARPRLECDLQRGRHYLRQPAHVGRQHDQVGRLAHVPGQDQRER